jgi:diadenosine tetraphosphate (Ap4A) HIT family hydrolase
MYQLHPRLAADTLAIGQFNLCDVRLMNDARYPWVILVPRKEGITESYQLTEDEQQQLMKESAFVAEQLASLVGADKMNVAALGNVVSQCHIHHIARYTTDENWPAPVWGKGEAIPYQQDEAQAVIAQLTVIFAEFLRDGV